MINDESAKLVDDAILSGDAFVHHHPYKKDAAQKFYIPLKREGSKVTCHIVSLLKSKTGRYWPHKPLDRGAVKIRIFYDVPHTFFVEVPMDVAHRGDIVRLVRTYVTEIEAACNFDLLL